MEFSIDFFRDEVRDGFYIPTAIKQAWAANLAVLGEIDRICEKHHISYYADWGSILGAVRHGGFIPWDDDLDICMKRDDYIRFRAVADAELPKEYRIHDYARQEDHWLFLARVVNQSQICFEQAHLEKYHNFPYMVGVDIFLQDYLYRDEREEKKRSEEIKRLLAVAEGILTGGFQRETILHEFALINERYGVALDPDCSPRELGIALYGLVEQQMARVPKKEADTVGQIFPWVLKGGKGLPLEYYEPMVRLPFENTTIPVPACYHKVLQSRYGEYLQVHKVWNGHEYPSFESQRENLLAVADFKLPGFYFSSEMLQRMLPNSGESLKSIAAECVKQLNILMDSMVGGIEAQEYEDVLLMLPECQQLVVDFATLLEEVKGEEHRTSRMVVDAIQAFCDVLYELYLAVDALLGGRGNGDMSEGQDNAGITGECAGDGISVQRESEAASGQVQLKTEQMVQIFEALKHRIDTEVIDRKEILFLPTGPREWRGFASLYEAIAADDRYDVSVVPLPMLFKDPLGRITEEGEEIEAAVRREDYPSDVPLLSWATYSLQLHAPEQIYIQNPYDGENPCLTVPPQYYARNLQLYTEKLIYIPAFEVDEFGSEDVNDLYNMKHYVTAPGVVYADVVVVQSENMKAQYVEKLTEFAGEATRSYWEEKLQPLGLPVADWKLFPGQRQNWDQLYLTDGLDTETKAAFDIGDMQDRGVIPQSRDKKKMLYCIGLNELSEHDQNLFRCVRERMEIFRENREAIQVTVCMYPPDAAEWKQLDPQASQELERLIASCAAEGWCSRCKLTGDVYESLAAEHDAYYGSASPLVVPFVREKKPVMIADYEVTV